MHVHFAPVRGVPGFLLPVVVARTPEELHRGLSHRLHLPPRQGMLFAWPEEGVRTFWMRDTHVPLDMAFVGADGVITRVVYGAPPDRDTSYVGVARWVVEAPTPWMSAHGVAQGGVATLRG